MVHPGAALSLQMHHQRAEHWVVVRGRAQVTVGDKVSILEENQSVYIPVETSTGSRIPAASRFRLSRCNRAPISARTTSCGSTMFMAASSKKPPGGIAAPFRVFVAVDALYLPVGCFYAVRSTTVAFTLQSKPFYVPPGRICLATNGETGSSAGEIIPSRAFAGVRMEVFHNVPRNHRSTAMAAAGGGAARRQAAEPPVRLVRPGNEDITIGENSVLEGSFDTRGSMFVDGAAINADLNAGFLSIGTTGRVEGQALVERAEISGAFDGTLVSSGEIILRASARIDGDVKCAASRHASRCDHRGPGSHRRRGRA